MKTKSKAKPRPSTEFTCEDGYKEAQALAPYLGKEVKSAFGVDRGTKQYLIGLKYTTGIEGWSRYWTSKVRYTFAGRTEERWTSIKFVKPFKKRCLFCGNEGWIYQLNGKVRKCGRC